MLTFISVIIIILSILLTILVLLQPGKGDIASSLGGLTGQFSSVLGSRKTADMLTKLTIGFAAAIMVLSIFANLFFVGSDSEKIKTVIEGMELPATPASPLQQSPKAAPPQQQQPQQQQPQQQPK
ncbi:MAG: preprotein translocase subunit SecG [Bacteroidota bacterium]|nr:preprotein translocase subunit SecG [Bacteroidota bacterium]